MITVLGFSSKAGKKIAGQKIVSLNGTISEILAGIGMEPYIIGTDVTSNFPESIKRKPKVGHNRTISAEGIIALQPDIVTGLTTDVKPELQAQLKGAGIKLVLFNQEFTADGTRKLIKEVATAFGAPSKANPVIDKLNADLASAAKSGKTGGKPKVLFIYARGTGTMMVAGEGTSVEQIIELAGGQNAVKGFTDYKPLTPEALVAADPDAILLFSSGMESLGGVAGLQQVQGVNQTKAGKNKKFITMEGELLTGFGPRLGQAVAQLSQNLK
ncbi:heme/hemin ABC transporter substrate-binding protein [Mucilaginibacter auburnensis]|uniref:Iron complex transport system substrate-binding protein n=1 Tax=Mucilaginibacter auburnensis TaxID=1457233 RepID=A0A2H9VW10_9SPHI|nr:ABC transporter substrate-binding protein [Mucilaginibacter auburnensis]PJJ85015.1 iron complex transport system substrate-binding protein [Mucilaginibacter auburnensis]